MTQPVIVAVDDAPAALAQVEAELTKRYGTDYEIVARRSPEAALVVLRQLREAERPVALVLADLWMTPTSGIEVLGLAGGLHPTARRGLLVDWVDVTRSKRQLVEAWAMGQIDCTIRKPAGARDEQFHHVVTELLREWTKAHGDGRPVVQVVGEPWSPRCHEVKDLLTRYGISFKSYALDSPEGRAVLEAAGADAASCPVLALADGRVLVNPTNRQAADAFGANLDQVDGEFDLAVVGAGPAGLAVAVYAASEGLRTLVVEREAIGGQAGTTSRIRNYLGFPRGVSGSDLAVRAYEQAWYFGASFRLLREALVLRPGVPCHTLSLAEGEEVQARAVVVATGVAYRRLGPPSLERLVGRGVFYGPAVGEAPSMASQSVFVVGAGNSAGQAAVHLARYASRVTMLVRGDSLAAGMSDYLVTEIRGTRNIEVRFGTEAVGGTGEHRLEQVVVRDRRRGMEETLPAAGLFVLIGGEPRTQWLPPQIRRCPRGYVLTGADVAEAVPHGDPVSCAHWSPGTLPLETSVPGIFAAGDVRHRSVKRVASAAGEGAMVVALVHEHLARADRALVTPS
ncbi:MAG TPA: FAD-dependent oxidoreductase [Acidimicrobiales bacterium]|nr:FAD-dependent oxidoreductase [Acidimicrobiales bacterium]